MKRIVAAGYAESRLNGDLLRGKDGIRAEIARAVADKDRALERDFRLNAVKELCFVTALGGGKKLALAAADKELEEQLAALRALVGASR